MGRIASDGRDYLWILSRSPTMDPKQYDTILDRLRAKHYPLDRLKKTIQPTTTTKGES